MNSAFENVLRNRTIITCPPVQKPEESTRTRKKSQDLNVAEDFGDSCVERNDSDSCASIILVMEEPDEPKKPVKPGKPVNLGKSSNPTKPSGKFADIVKIEKLKDLLERINYQKKLLLRELEKHEEIPGPDLEKVLKCIEKLENEKKVLTDSSEDNFKSDTKENEDPAKKKAMAELVTREKKLEERERKLEDKIRELYRQEKQKKVEKQKKLEIVEVDDSNATISSNGSPAPVEIVIKVNSRSPRVKKTKKSRVIDTLSREPGKVYPKTPIRKLKRSKNEEISSQNEEPEVVDQQEDENRGAIKKISDKSTSITGISQLAQNQSLEPKNLDDSEDSSILHIPDTRKMMEDTKKLMGKSRNTEKAVDKPKKLEERATMTEKRSLDIYMRRNSGFTDSTSYRSLPEPKIQEDFPLQPLDQEKEERSIKLNPHLMHYIGRLLGMPKNVGDHLGVSVSTVSTPGSSTVNTSGNISEVVEPSFDTERLDRLKRFIDDNYSFLSEINESLEKSRVAGSEDEEQKRIDGVWKDVLSKSPRKVQGKLRKSQATSMESQAASLGSDKITNGQGKSSISVESQTVPQKSKVPEFRLPEKSRVPEKSKKSKDSRENPQKRPGILKTNEKSDGKTRKSEVPAKSILKGSNKAKNSQAKETEESRPETAASQSSKSQDSKPKQNVQSNQQAITSNDVLNITKYLEAHMINSYVESTSNCQKRIADLAEMMEKVQQEKTKLIESSAENSRKYQENSREKSAPISTQEAATSSGSELKSPSNQDPPSEEINNILMTKSRQIGISKDSGICMSRPVTSSDYRDSPEHTFQPISKSQKQKSSDEDLAKLILNGLHKIVQHTKDKDKKTKPPAAMTRFSPQNEEKAAEPHELSTIAEVETPGTSKVTIQEVEVPQENLEYQEFKDYNQYVQEREMDELLDVQKKLEQIKEVVNTDYQEFMDPKTYGLEEISSLHQEELDNVSQQSSIQDMVEELKKRKLIDDSGSEASRTSSSPLKKILESEKTTPATETHQILQPSSPKKQQTQSRVGITTPDQKIPQGQAERTKTPTKKKQSPGKEMFHHPLSENQKNDTLSGIVAIADNLKEDLEKLGLNWAALTLKRTQESQTMKSTSSSSGNLSKEHPVYRRTIEIEIEDSLSTPMSSTSSDTSGQPLNLKEFLKRELTLKSDRNLTNESSLASPIFPNVSSQGSSSKISDKNMLRTSTPVEESKSRASTRMEHREQTIFPGESLSTVKMSSSEADASRSHNDS